MNKHPDIDHYIVSVYADFNGYAVSLIGVNEDLKKFWLFEQFNETQPSLNSIIDDLDLLFDEYPINKMVTNQELIVDLMNEKYIKKQYVNTPTEKYYGNAIVYSGEQRTKALLAEFDIAKSAFILFSLINDRNFLIRKELLERDKGIEENIKNFEVDITDHKLYSIFQYIANLSYKSYFSVGRYII